MAERLVRVLVSLAEADAALAVMQSVLSEKRLDKKQIDGLAVSARAAIERAHAELASIRGEMRKAWLFERWRKNQ